MIGPDKNYIRFVSDFYIVSNFYHFLSDFLNRIVGDREHSRDGVCSSPESMQLRLRCPIDLCRKLDSGGVLFTTFSQWIAKETDRFGAGLRREKTC